MVWEPLLKSSKSQLDLDWILDPANRGEYDTRGGWFGKAKMITNGPYWKLAWGLYQYTWLIRFFIIFIFSAIVSCKQLQNKIDVHKEIWTKTSICQKTSYYSLNCICLLIYPIPVIVYFNLYTLFTYALTLKSNARLAKQHPKHARTPSLKLA